ncbi:MAG: 50S ribosomal protein L29 [Nanoarchaeota archaeon]
MAIIKKNELKGMSTDLLNSKLEELKKELIKINAKRAVGTVPESPGKIKEIRRTIARILTILKTKKEVKK